MDPVTLALLISGMGAKFAGGMFGLSDQQRKADAANAVLKASLAKQQGYAAQNENTMQGVLDSYGGQPQQLAGAQAARSANNVANISGPDTGAIPITPGAPPAVGGEIAKRMGAANTYAKGVAGAQGKLGGYGDSWLQNQLRASQAGRDIGVVNNYSEGEKSLLKPMQDAAMAAQPPSVWGPLLSGAGDIATFAAGARGSGGGAPTNLGTSSYGYVNQGPVKPGFSLSDLWS